MTQKGSNQVKELRAKMKQKKEATVRTAFQFTPKTSKLLNWLLETTDISVNGLFRIGFESFVVAHAKEVFNDLESSQKTQKQPKHRRSVAIDRNLNKVITKYAKEAKLTRSIIASASIEILSYSWIQSMKIQLENAKLMEDCIEAAQKLIQYPNFNSLKDKYPIEDEDFWAALNDNWSMSIESVFYQENH